MYFLDPLIRDVTIFSQTTSLAVTHLPPATTMSPTQPIDSAEKVNADVGPINQQPTPALAMSTDPNGPGQRAMRLRGGCCVRHSSVIPIPITYALFSKSKCPVVAAI